MAKPLAIKGRRRLCDELMMNRENPGRTNFVKGEKLDHNGGEPASCPTITMSATRGHINGGNRAQAVNRSVMRKAIKAFDAGDEISAFEVLDMYLSGLNEMTPPVDLNHGHIQTLVGFQSFEVIHEDICQEVAALYERLKPYIDKNCPEKRGIYDAALRKWADLIIANGVPDNNWNLIQARFIYAIAKVLPKADHDRYLDIILHAKEVRQWGLKTLADAGFDAETGIWNESPGYSVNVVNDYIDIAAQLKRDGKDKFHDYFYHNLGTGMTLSVPTEPTTDLAFAGGHLYAYSYFWDKERGDGAKNVVATWSDGTRLFMAGSENRKVYKVKAPPTEGLSRMPNQPYDLKTAPTYTFVARQMGEAWEHPFVCVMDSSGTVDDIDVNGDVLVVRLRDGSVRELEISAGVAEESMATGHTHQVVGSEEMNELKTQHDAAARGRARRAR